MKNLNKNTNKFFFDKYVSYGLHVGSFKSFWNPNMKVYISGIRNNFCVLNLHLTHKNLRQGLKFLSKVILSKKKILFIGAPKGMEKNFALLCRRYDHYFLDNYDDGFFTNFHQDRKDKSLDVPPSLVFFFDISNHEKVKREVSLLNIPILAIVNSSDNVKGIDYPIPANIQTWKGGIFIYNLLYHCFLWSEKNCLFVTRNNKQTRKK